MVKNTEKYKAQKRARQAITVAKDQEEQRVKDGWKWMSKAKATKHVHPSRVEQMIQEGWK